MSKIGLYPSNTLTQESSSLLFKPWHCLALFGGVFQFANFAWLSLVRVRGGVFFKSSVLLLIDPWKGQEC